MKKEKRITLFFGAIIIVLSLGADFWFNHLNNSQIKFLLDFYKNVVEIFFSNSHWFNKELLQYWGNDYVIGESCLGLNIIVLLFAVGSITNVGSLKGIKRIAWILFSGIMAVVLGVFANILRLLSSIYFTAFASFAKIHLLLGIVIYLSAIVLCYTFSKKIAIKNNFGGESIEEHI